MKRRDAPAVNKGGPRVPSTVMDHEIDPKEAILQKVGDLSGIDVFGNDILTAIYERPQKTASGIILADQSRDEDRWQSKVALVLKMGPTAFVDDDGNKFRDIDVGDWVALRPSDGQLVTLNSLRKIGVSKDNVVLCRIISDVAIRLRVAHPDQVY